MPRKKANKNKMTIIVIIVSIIAVTMIYSSITNYNSEYNYVCHDGTEVEDLNSCKYGIFDTTLYKDNFFSFQIEIPNKLTEAETYIYDSYEYDFGFRPLLLYFNHNLYTEEWNEELSFVFENVGSENKNLTVEEYSQLGSDVLRNELGIHAITYYSSKILVNGEEGLITKSKHNTLGFNFEVQQLIIKREEGFYVLSYGTYNNFGEEQELADYIFSSIKIT